MTSFEGVSVRSAARINDPNHGCLNGTRVNILREVKDWLQDSKSENILWIVGAPGAGKSTIATTIAEKLADTVPFCSKFFCKRDVENLRDPRRIWRTLAYNLASKHDGVKAALMATLIDKRIGDPLEISVCKQFENLIKSPLETDLKETGDKLSITPNSIPCDHH